MSAFSSSILRLCSLVIPAVAASVQVTSAAGQDLRNVAVVEGCSKTFHAANAVERNSGGSRVNQSSAWKPKSTRGWTASVPPRGPRRIQLVSATSTEEPKTSSRSAGSITSGESDNGTSPVNVEPSKTAEPVAAATDFPPVPDAHPLTATEKFKRALAEQRRALEEQAARNESQDSSLNTQTPVEKPKKSPGLTATVDADLQSDDPLKREMAERFQRLKDD